MVKINETFCKGCSYCIKYCPKNILELGTVRSAKGYFYPHVTDEEKCTSCTICATICPDGAIEIIDERKGK